MIGYILIIVLGLSLSFLAGLMAMDDNKHHYWVSAVSVILVTFGTLGVAMETYQKGQIDAINGNIHMILTTQPDREQKWEYK